MDQPEIDDEILSELSVILPNGKVRNSPDARYEARILRLLGASEDAIVENYGYSPEPEN